MFILFKISPTVDLFASRINAKLPNYFSWGPDSFSLSCDAFVTEWPNCVYAFPPIHLVDKFLHRFLHLNVEFALLISPFWPSATYFPLLLDLLVDSPLLIPVSEILHADLLPRQVSFLMVSSISSRSTLREGFHAQLQHVSSVPLEPTPSAPTYVAGSPLHIGVIRGRSVTGTFL